jgi:AcrR family transcriptional regulator
VTNDRKPQQRRKSPKGAERRNQILDAAMRIFSRDGYQNAAIADVADDVGLSLPGLLHHFPSKAELLLATLERRDLESIPILGGEHPHWRVLLENLCLLNRRNAGSSELIRAFSLLNAESLIDNHPANTWFRQRSERVKAQFMLVIDGGKASGEIRPDVNSQAVAAQIVAVMDGLQILWLRDPETFDLVSSFDDFVARLVTSIESPPANRAAPSALA